MKKLVIVVMGLAIAVAASANLVVNGSFEQTFTDGFAQTVDATIDGSLAYGSDGGGANHIPAWGGDQNWGYAVNPDGGLNQFGLAANPASATDGTVVYGAGNPAHYFGIWQNTSDNGSGYADGTKDYKLTFDFYHSSAIAGSWLTAKIQMPTGVGGSVEASLGGVGVDPGLSLDAWHTVELTLPANAAFNGSDVQVFLQGSGGSFVDNVNLVAIPEPSTLGLLVLVGGGMIWTRKHFSI